MKKSTLSMISILIVLFGMFCAVQDALAVDPPHNGKNSVDATMTCSSCHFDATVGTPSWATQPTTTDETFYNNMCTSCHNASGVSDSQYIVKTHASSNFTGKYGTWSIECRVCHNPHTQDTVTSFPTDSGIDLLTSTVSATCVQVNATAPQHTFFVNGGLVPNAWIDFTVVPNTAYPTKMYRIKSNTANSITVFGAMNCNYVKFNKPYGIRNGKLMHTQIRTPDGSTPIVKYYTKDSSKPNSYASSTDPANVTGICQICHTQTKSFNRTNVTGSIQEGPNHPQVITSGQICTNCHIHTEGFKGECNACHGYPPSSTATLVFKSKSNVDVISDSGSGPGAHVKHVDSVKLVCANCHANGMLAGSGAGDDKINIGFNWKNDTSGNYVGDTSRLVYPLTGTNVTPGVTYQCSNLYCHSSGQAADGGAGAPVYKTPKWNDPSTGACGTCHDVTAPLLSTGSHTKHLTLDTNCGNCHTGASATAYSSTDHVNRTIEVANGYPSPGAPGNGYATCSAASCHANVYGPGTVPTPVWGTASDCSACHSVAITATGPATGGHVLHNDTNCEDCHNAGTTATTKPSTGHADGNIDVTNGYPANKAKGSAYATCSTASCHADPYGPATSVTPTWDTSGNGCNACHSAYPIAATGPATGSHVLHNESDCTKCHNAGTTAATKPTTSHADGFINVTNGYPANKAKGSAYSTCSTASCHANVYGSGTTTTPVWGSTGSGCSACHSVVIGSTGPATGSHVLHNDSTCTHCHNAGTTAATKPTTSHADGFINVTNGYPANKAKGSAYSTCSTAACHGASSPVWGANTANAQCVKCHGVAGATPAQYAADPNIAAPGYVSTAPVGTGRDTAGNTAPTFPKVGAHDVHLRGVGGYKTGGIGCNDCHAVTSLNDAGHMNGSTTFAWSSLATNSGALAPNYAGGVCSNVYCHGASFVATQGTDTTPVWTDGTYLANAASTMNSTDCNKCHQSPAFANGNYNHSGIVIGVGNCNACHDHDGAGATHIDGILQAQGGACNSCHDYDVDPDTEDWGKKPKAIEGWGAHATHISHLKAVSGVTLSAAGDAFGGAAYSQVCGVCHTKLTAYHVMSGGTATRQINFGDSSLAYQFSTSESPTYAGVTGVSSSTRAKTCSNISCHYQTSPVWEGY